MKRRNAYHRFARVLAAGALGLWACTAPAQPSNFPQKPVKIVLPFAAGGASDVMARLIADRLGKLWQQPVIVENKTGASGIVAAEAVTRAEPDGYTALLTVTALVQAPALYGKASYDPIKDLSPVSQVATMPVTLAVSPSVPAKTLNEFLALARAKPGHYSYGSFGTGSAGHLYMEILKDAANVDILHVPYKGEMPAINDLLSGQVSAVIVSVPGARPFANSGKLLPVAVTGTVRTQQLPDTPTFVESGFRDLGLESIGWYGMLLPAKTPREVTDKFSADLNKVLADPDLKKRMAEYGINLTGTTPAAFAEIVKSDSARWTKVIREKHIKAD